MIAVTPLILTFNEKENIGRTLSALQWAQRVIVVDSFSDDGTVAIARLAHPNVEIVQRQFDTHATQWNFGLDRVQTEWVLSLDADYELSPELIEELTTLLPSPDIAGYFARFEYRIRGRPLRASVYPPRVVLFRKSKARYRDEGHTQMLQADGKLPLLEGKIYHDDRKTFSHWIRAQNRYAILEARHLLVKPLDQLDRPDRLRRKIVFAPPAMFLYLFFGRGLILDGWRGWFYVAQRTIAEFLLSVRLLIERKSWNAEN